MKVLIVSYSDSRAGAFAAAKRLHQALMESDMCSTMLVAKKSTDIPSVISTSEVAKPCGKIRRIASNWPLLILPRTRRILRSTSFFGTNKLVEFINGSDFDVINLHWINGMISSKQISRIQKPIVWTLHDMWPLTGSYHYYSDSDAAYWRAGNSSFDENAALFESWFLKRKNKHFNNVSAVISPSKWLAQCASQSKVFGNIPSHEIANPLDLSVFRSRDKNQSRQKFNLPLNKPLLLFGAISGTGDRRKGFDLLLEALDYSKNSSVDFDVVVFGSNNASVSSNFSGHIHFVGKISSDEEMAHLYSAADCMVVPSRTDNLPQTATEAQACGCPVVAFDCGGLASAVEHGKSGFLAPAEDTKQLWNYIQLILADKNLRDKMGKYSSSRSSHNWNPERLVSKYVNVFNEVISRNSSQKVQLFVYSGA